MSSTSTASPALLIEKPRKSIPASVYGVMVIGILLDSFGSSLIRLTLDNGMTPLAITGLRLPLAWLIFTPIVLFRYRPALGRMSRHDLLLTALAGMSFTAMLVLAFVAVDNTEIMVVQVMFSTSLLWVAGMETLLLKARLPRLVLVGVIVSFAGSTMIGLASTGSNETNPPVEEQTLNSEQAETTSEGHPLLGALAGLGGALTSAGYLVIGRKVREKVPLVPYLWGIYGSGTVFALVLVGITQTPLTSYSMEAYFWLLVLLLVAHLGIHVGFNYIVGYLTATFVNISWQTVTLTSAIIAFVLFAEVPSRLEIAGSMVIMAGVVLAILGRRKRQ